MISTRWRTRLAVIAASRYRGMYSGQMRTWAHFNQRLNNVLPNLGAGD